ncbi:MAG: Fic family protein [Akkermansiaceae bacterium]|nr:Fic family protein [Akkermansiaceae bacterium]MCF7734516.1 Fic family protein [Akkermansiaceae bacterium]
MLPPKIQLSNEMLRLIASIDEFKGEWRAVESIKPDRLQSLRRVATIESIGSSTRIEGARLSDREVEDLLRGLQTESFRSRDEEEVAGYAYVMETIQVSWTEMPVSEGIVLQLHRDLLRYSTKDERHRGEWKTLPNHVVAVGPDGKQVGVVFETASPFDTPRLMGDLLAWLAKEEREPSLHPLLRIAVFVVVFLAIHPFQDGNGRLSRILNNLLLLRGGYSFASYSSLESVIEHSKEAYYLALRRTQTTLGTGTADWEPWLMFFLHSIQSQITRLRANLEGVEVRAVQRRLSPLAERLSKLLGERGTLTVAEAASATDANRNTIKDKLAELVEQRLAELHGKGRGAHYRPVIR